MDNVCDDPWVNQLNETMKVVRFPLAAYEMYTDRDGKMEPINNVLMNAPHFSEEIAGKPQ